MNWKNSDIKDILCDCIYTTAKLHLGDDHSRYYLSGDIDGKGLEPSSLDNILCIFLGFGFLGMYIHENLLSVWFVCFTRCKLYLSRKKSGPEGRHLNTVSILKGKREAKGC